MSDRGNDDLLDEIKDDNKRAYLPLVNHPSSQSEEVNPRAINNKSVVSNDHTADQKYSQVNLAGQNQQTFYQKNRKIILIAGAILLLIGVVLAIVLPLTLGKGGGGPNPPDPDNPVEPDPFQYQEFNPYFTDPANPPVITTFEADIKLKYNNVAFGGETAQPSKPRFSKAVARFMGFEDQEDLLSDTPKIDGSNYRPMNPRYILNSPTNMWAQNANIKIQMNSNNQARVMVINSDTDSNETLRRSVNPNLFPRPKIEIESRLQQVGFALNTTGSVSFNFTDIYSHETLLTTSDRKLLLTDLYSEIGLVVPTQRCFGLGQRNGKFQLDAGTYTFNARARDDSLPQDDGLGGKSSNHIHPFMLCQSEVKKDFFGVYFASTGPQVFEVVKFYNSTKMVINYITVAGAIEFYVLVRGTAQEVIARYHSLVGMPMLPPYYALGLWHGSNSYDTWPKIQSVYDNYAGASPTGAKQALEGLMIESFNQQPHWSLTVNPQTFPSLPAQVAKIHANNQKIVFGASLAISADSSYPFYAGAKAGNCLVTSLWSVAQGPLTGVLEQTEVQYLDTYNKCFDSFLDGSLPTFDTNTGSFDGLLVKDAYTPNHINGQVAATASDKQQQHLKSRHLEQSSSADIKTALNEEQVGFYASYQFYNDTTTDHGLSTYYLPFIPSFTYSGALDNMTISLNSSLGDDMNGGRLSTLYAKNGMAGYALKKIYNAVNTTKQGKTRPLLFSDSSFAGSGQYSAGLVTDLYRSWEDMGNVIGQVVALSMHGMSATMVDTCGSLGPVDEDICSKWTQLSTFMPMVRNYFNATYRDQHSGNRMKTDGLEPWNAQTPQLQLAYASIGDRLMYSRYIYTQMYLTHTQGGSLVKPLFFDFPKDDMCFSDQVQGSTFMLGEAIKVTPVLEKKEDGQNFDAYFPQGVWVSLYDSSKIITAPASGINASLPVDSTRVNIHQKSGTIIPFLNNNQNLKTTRDIEQNLKTTFRVVRDPASNSAEGHVMLDDGVSPNLFSPPYMDTWMHDTYDKNFQHYTVRYSSNKTLNFMLSNGDASYQVPSTMQYQYLDEIEILNAEDLNDADFACSIDKSWTPTKMQVDYYDSKKMLVIKPLPGVKMTFDQLMVVKFGNSKKDSSYCDGFSYTGQIVDEGDGDLKMTMNLTSNQPATSGVEDLVAEFTLLDDNGSILIEITTVSDYNSLKTKLYRPPTPEFYDLPSYQKKNVPKKKLDDFLKVDSKPFAYYIRNSDQVTIYQSDPLRLLITDYFVIDSGVFTVSAKSGRSILGIGERAGKGMLQNQKDSVHTIWPYDAPNPIDDGKAPGKNMYGYQPVYYYQAEDNINPSWVAVFDVGTYASDYFVNSDIDGKSTSRVTKVAVGGLINKIILQASKIETTIKKYQQLTGYQSVPPMWAFGWNQCKFGYYNSSIWWDVYQNYGTYNIPLDTMWADIDYMDDYKVFTISQQSYSDLSEKVDLIRNDGRYFVPIIDNAIAVRDGIGYQPYEDGLAQKVFIMKKDLSSPATGAVWPGQAYYPDFFKPETITWWHDNLKKFNEKIKFDGIWLDMNEPSSTCTGYCDQTDRPSDSIKFKIPYLPGQRDLEVQALGLDTVHTGLPDGNGGFRTERDVRSLYAIKESQATYSYLNQDGKRPFVLSRSNAPGLQKYAFHWLADNWSKDEWLATSIDSLYSYNLFGIPMMGSDICGFNLDATPQLCTRWHQLGSFYPFARNHKNSVWKQTEPFQYNFTGPDIDDGRTYTDLIRTALLQRYSLLRYSYSSFHQIGTEGGAFFKPLYYDFQDDQTTYDSDSTQRNILLGSALKLSIQVQNFDQVSTEYQFPASRWCQVMPSIDPTKCWDTTPEGGSTTVQRLDSSISDYQVHLRGGRLIPFQDAVALKVNKSQDLMQNPTEIIVLTNAKNGDIEVSPNTYKAQAAGLVYLDDGTSANDIARIDVAVVSNDDGTFTIDFTKVSDLKNRAAAGQASTLSAITFLWASGTGYNNIKTAKLIEASGASIDLSLPVYDPKSDTLKVVLANSQAGKSWAFWDIDKINLSN